jgi:methylase of polypeptide subunit release factors
VAAEERPLDDSVLGKALAAEDSVQALRSVAAHLHRAGFDEHRAAAVLGAPSAEHLLGNPARHAFFAERRRPGPSTAPVSVLTSLFILNRTVPADWVHGALAPELTDLLRDLSLLTRSGEEYQGTVSITPYRSRFFLSDRLFSSPEPQQVVAASGANLVMPPHASSLLALDTVDRIEDSFLDVGCGGGFLALNAGEKCGRVAGIDLNPRCVSFAAANSTLNSLDATFSVEDFASLSAVGGARFGSLLFNAPTLPRIDPEDGEFGQTTAEQVIRKTAATAPRILRPGGTAFVLTLVEVPEKFGSATDAVHHWLSGTDVRDLTVTEIDTPQLTLTRQQLTDRQLPGQSLLVYGAVHAKRLMSALVERGIGSVGLAMVAIRI